LALTASGHATYAYVLWLLVETEFAMHGVQLNNIVVIHIDLCGLLLSSKHTEQSRQSPIQHCV